MSNVHSIAEPLADFSPQFERQTGRLPYWILCAAIISGVAALVLTAVGKV